jgi:hypothetical protein
MVGDAMRALELLGRHPRIDPTRIVVMGCSLPRLGERTAAPAAAVTSCLKIHSSSKIEIWTNKTSCCRWRRWPSLFA